MADWQRYIPDHKFRHIFDCHFCSSHGTIIVLGITYNPVNRFLLVTCIEKGYHRARECAIDIGEIIEEKG